MPTTQLATHVINQPLYCQLLNLQLSSQPAKQNVDLLPPWMALQTPFHTPGYYLPIYPSLPLHVYTFHLPTYPCTDIPSHTHNTFLPTNIYLSTNYLPFYLLTSTQPYLIYLLKSTYLPSYLPTFLPTFLPTYHYLPTYLHVPSCLTLPHFLFVCFLHQTTRRHATSPTFTPGRHATFPTSTIGQHATSPTSTTGRHATSPTSATGRHATSPTSTPGRHATFQTCTSGRHVQEERNRESDTLQPEIQSDPTGKPNLNTEASTEIHADPSILIKSLSPENENAYSNNNVAQCRKSQSVNDPKQSTTTFSPCQSAKRTTSILNKADSQSESDQPGCSFWTNSDYPKAKRQRRNQRYYANHKEKICEQQKAKYVQKKSELLSKKKVSYEKNRPALLQSKKVNYQRNRPELLNKRKNRYERHRSALLKKEKASYEQHRPAILKKKKASYEQHRPALLKKRKASYEQHRPALLKKKKASYEQHRPAVLKKKKASYEQHRPALLKKMKASYQRNRPQILSKRRANYEEHRPAYLKKKQNSYQRNKALLLIKRSLNYMRNRSVILSKKRTSYMVNPSRRAKQIQQTASSRKSSKSNIDTVVKKFKTEIQKEKPIYTCIMCNRLFFRNQVVKFQKAKYDQRSLLSPMPAGTDYCNLPTANAWICKTCHGNIKKNIVPRLSNANNLVLCPQPPELSELNILERHLIAPVIPFMKLVPLYKGCQKGIHGQVVCVKADVDSTAKALPRLPTDDSLVRVKLKRKLQYKSHVIYRQVCPSKIRTALNLLKETNPVFRDIEIDTHQLDAIQDDPIIANENDQHISDSEMQDSDIETREAKLIDLLHQQDTFCNITPEVVQNDHIPTANDEQSVNSEVEKSDIETHVSELIDILHKLDTPDSDPLESVDNDLNIGTENDHQISDSEAELSDIEIQEAVLIDTPHEQDIADTSNKENPEVQHDDDITNTSAPLTSFLQPVDFTQYVADHSDESILNLAPAEGNRPINVLNVEAEAFPTQFPDGKNTYKEHRDPKVSPSRYFNARLFSADTRFASDPEYIFFAQYATELNMITSQISIAMRQGHTQTVDGRPITSDILTNKDQVKQMIQRDTGFRYLRQIRGTPAYWDKTLKDLFAMIRQIGIPTWFVTFSAADRRWIEIDNAILEQQGKPPMSSEEHSDMDWETHCQNIFSNPVTAARMFDHRVKKFIKDVIQSPAQPIGNVTDFFYRTEFQQRGWPHIHMLVWVQDAPDPYTVSDHEIVDFVDKYVSCELPSENDDPELHEIVKSCQMHSKNHTKSCRKTGKTCRFAFPKPPSDRTFIARVLNSYGDENEDETDDENDHNISAHDQYDEQGEADAKNEAQEVIKKVHDALNNADTEITENTTATEIFDSVNVTQEDMEEALETVASRSNVYLKRKPTDVLVNNYNPHLIRAWNGNMDIQFVLDAYSCVKYILSYISKAERQVGDLLKNAQNEARQEDSDALTELRKVGNVYLHSRELSVMESIYRVCSMHLKDCTRDVVFVQTDPDGQRISLPLSVLKNKDSTEDVWMTNLLDKYYGKPTITKFNQMCLAKFASNFRFQSSKTVDRSTYDESDEEENNESDTCKKYSLQNHGRDLGIAIERKGKPAIIRYPKIKLEKDPEKYYMNILRMYLPHTDIQLKPHDYDSYASYYHSGSITTQEGVKSVKEIVTDNMKQYEPINDKIDHAWIQMQNADNLEDAWAALAPQAEQQRLDDLEDKPSLDNESDDDFDDIEIPELQPNTSKKSDDNSYRSPVETIRSIPSDDHVASMIRALNDKQLQLFKYVHQWCMKKVNGENPEPFRIFLTGGAGTGKSHVTRCIRYHTEKIFQTLCDSQDDRTVLVVAHTGTAAFNVEGETICSALKISINAPRDYKPLAEDSLNTMRTKFEHLQLLIIDEISMVTQKQLRYIHGRLQQIKRASNQSYFGNLCVLAVGDFYQIPPINPSTPLCIPDDNPLNDLWTDNFRICKLTQIMRQRDDLEFALLLNRLRVLTKTDTIDPADDEKLRARTLDSGTDLTPPKEALHIYALNVDVRSHNRKMLLSLPSQTITIHAVDMKQNAGQSQSRKNPYNSEQIGKTVLESEIELAEGARVMLTTNLDVLDGLCNGVTGIVRAILPNDTNNQPSAVYVQFDNARCGANARRKSPLPNEYANCVVIKPHQESIEVSDKSGRQTRTRKQYPLKLAWAVTMHKVQGQTTENAVVSLNKTRACMAYVAISRVTNLNGLYLSNYDGKRIYCNEAVTHHLSKMLPCDLSLANQVLNTNQREHFIIIHHNVQSLSKHADDIKCDFEIRKAHVIGLSETWLSTNHDKTQYELPGYQLVSIDKAPEEARGRGVGMYVHETVQFDTLTLEVDECDILAIRTKGIPSMVIMTVYKPISTSISVLSNVLNDLCTMIETFAVDYVVILGDFNHDLLKKPPISALRRYNQLIDSPTTAKGTLVDHIYIKPLPAAYKASVLASHFSYHEPISLSIRL